jgi:hypothetical protein
VRAVQGKAKQGLQQPLVVAELRRRKGEGKTDLDPLDLLDLAARVAPKQLRPGDPKDDDYYYYL